MELEGLAISNEQIPDFNNEFFQESRISKYANIEGAIYYFAYLNKRGVAYSNIFLRQATKEYCEGKCLPSNIPREGKIVHLNIFRVKESFRRLKIGKLFLNFILEEMKRKHGAKWAYIIPSLPDGRINNEYRLFLTKCGFERCGLSPMFVKKL